MKNRPAPSPEPLHRRTLAPLIQSQVEAIGAENARMKAEILARPETEWTWLDHVMLGYMKAREDFELLESLGLKANESPSRSRSTP